MAYVTEESDDDDSDGDDSDDDDTDDGDDAGIQNAQTVDPRPLVPKKHRYRMGDTLHFSEAFFVGVVGGLEANPRVRLGVVTALERERPPSRRKGSNQERYLYTVEFENGQSTQEVDRLPLDRDPDVSFVREMLDDG